MLHVKEVLSSSNVNTIYRSPNSTELARTKKVRGVLLTVYTVTNNNEQNKSTRTENTRIVFEHSDQNR